MPFDPLLDHHGQDDGPVSFGHPRDPFRAALPVSPGEGFETFRGFRDRDFRFGRAGVRPGPAFEPAPKITQAITVNVE